MEDLINDFFRCLACFGWEADVYIKKNGTFDTATNNIDFVKKSDVGFEMYGFNFIYHE